MHIIRLLSLQPLCKWAAGAPSPWQQSRATSCGPGAQREMGKQIICVTHVHLEAVVWPCTLCVGPGMCVHVGVESSVCGRVGVNCGGLVFMPWAWGVCVCVSMRPLSTGMPACVRTWSEVGFGLRPVASKCKGPGSSVASHGCPA